MAKRDHLDPAISYRPVKARHEPQRMTPFRPDDRPRRAIMSPPRDHPHIKHWTVGSTMRYVRPSETFIEDAYRRAVSDTLASLREEGDGGGD